jgi:hypothetical protein
LNDEDQTGLTGKSTSKVGFIKNEGMRSTKELLSYLAQANRQKDYKTIKEREEVGSTLEK